MAILERAGYGGKALNVLFMLQMNLGEGSDWNSIVNNAELMESIFNNTSARYIVFNSTDAMNAVMASATARNALFANAAALREMWSYDFTTNLILSSTTLLTAISGSNAAMDALLTSSSNWGRVLSQTQNISTIIGNVSFRNRALTNTNARTQLFGNTTAVDSVIANSAAVTYVLANADSYNAMFSSSVAMGRVIQSASVMNLIYANNTAFTAMVSSTNAMGYIANSSSVMDTIIANTANFTTMMNSAVACGVIFENATASTRISTSTSAINVIVSNNTPWSKFIGSSEYSNAKKILIQNYATSGLSVPIILGAGTSRMNDILSRQDTVTCLTSAYARAFKLIYENEAYAAWRAAIIASDSVNTWILPLTSTWGGSQAIMSPASYILDVSYVTSGVDVTGYITVTGTWKSGSPKTLRYPASGNGVITNGMKFDIRGFGADVNVVVTRVSGGTISNSYLHYKDCM